MIKEGSSTAQIPIGQTVMVSFVRTPADMQCYVNGTERSMTVISGALAVWPGPAAGTTKIGAFVATEASNGVDGLLGEILITGLLTPTQRSVSGLSTADRTWSAHVA